MVGYRNKSNSFLFQEGAEEFSYFGSVLLLVFLVLLSCEGI